MAEAPSEGEGGSDSEQTAKEKDGIENLYLVFKYLHFLLSAHKKTSVPSYPALASLFLSIKVQREQLLNYTHMLS